MDKFLSNTSIDGKEIYQIGISLLHITLVIYQMVRRLSENCWFTQFHWIKYFAFVVSYLSKRKILFN